MVTVWQICRLVTLTSFSVIFLACLSPSCLSDSFLFKYLTLHLPFLNFTLIESIILLTWELWLLPHWRQCADHLRRMCRPWALLLQQWFVSTVSLAQHCGSPVFPTAQPQELSRAASAILISSVRLGLRTPTCQLILWLCKQMSIKCRRSYGWFEPHGGIAGGFLYKLVLSLDSHSPMPSSMTPHTSQVTCCPVQHTCWHLSAFAWELLCNPSALTE